MERDYWLSRWKTGQVGFDQDSPNTLLMDNFALLALKPKARVFVPLCGKSVDMLWLRQQGFSVLGVELSVDACQQFFERYQIPFRQRKNDRFITFCGDGITLFAGDYFDLTKDDIQPIDAIYDRAALIALPPLMREQYAQKLQDLSEMHTQILLVSISYLQEQMSGPPFSVPEDAVRTLFSHGFSIDTFYDAQITVPPHFEAKGLRELREMGFHLQRKSQTKEGTH